MKKLLFSIVVCMLFPVAMFAQIGYQVSLLNSATGEPRANERVSVTVEITNSEDEAIFLSTQNATSNDFGIISLTIGNADTFKDVDWAKLPFFIAVTVEGKLIAKSQILSVPVAEVAKAIVPAVPLDELCGKEWNTTWTTTYDSRTIFHKDGTCTQISKYCDETITVNNKYIIEGNNIYVYYIKDEDDKDEDEDDVFGSSFMAFRWIDGKIHFNR